jgi:hypothetical protein
LPTNFIYWLNRLIFSESISSHSDNIYISARTKPYLRRTYRQWHHWSWLEVTPFTWPEVCSTYAQIFSRTFFRFPALFSCYGSSTKCSTLVQVLWLLEVTERHITPKRVEGYAHAQPEVGHFHRKWRHQASRDPLKGWDARMRIWSCVTSDRKCSWSDL